MKCYLVLGEIPWKTSFEQNRPHLRKLERILFEKFKDYWPKPADIGGTYLYPAFEMSVPADDERFHDLLKTFCRMAKATKPPGVVVLREHPSPPEAARARFVMPAYRTDDVDGFRYETLNSGMFLCKHCHFPNLRAIPKPLLVDKTVLKKYDLFPATAGMLVVRPWVLDLLKRAIGGQFDFGEAAVAGSKAKARGNDRLFWVRPKETIGSRTRIFLPKKTCPACKRVKSWWVGGSDNMANATGPGLLDERVRVAHFGSGKADIALVDNLASGSWPTLDVSGALLTHLEANGIKGIWSSKKYPDVDCVFSEKGEPTLEAQQRTFGTPPGAPAKATLDKARLAKARTLAASLKSLPWDCSKDGYVYFHLSTPSFVLLDPMNCEEDDQGPYALKTFKGPGVYRLPVAAIRLGKKRGVAVDSGTLLFVDNAFFPEFLEQYDWNKATTKRGNFDLDYHQQISEQAGTRFGVCSPPPKKFKSDFEGDGYYTIDVKAITRVKP